MIKDMTGIVLGDLTFLKFVKKDKFNRAVWLCLCACGKKAEKAANNVRSGNTRSCGCKRFRLNGQERRTHGMSYTSEYCAYRNMIDRCCNINNKMYRYYGGRGIKICKKWLKSFEEFFKDMGKKPSKEHSLDRVDTNRGYKPSNCKWSTNKQQMSNRRRFASLETFTDKELTAEIIRRGWKIKTGKKDRNSG